MSTLLITNAGLNYKDAVFAGAEVQNITHFVFANVDGLLETDPISPTATIPTADVVHTQAVEMVSQLNDNAVVISCAMGYDIGTFDYNWYGVIATLADTTEVLIAVVHTNTQTKTKTVGASVGNYSVKSVVWRSNSIATQLNVTLSALPWQANHEEFVSKAEFAAHNHDTDYLKNDDINIEFIDENKIAIINKNKLHVFTNHADLQIPDTDGDKFKFVVDDSVDLSAGKCRVVAPVIGGVQQENMHIGYNIGSHANIQENGVIYTAIKANGVWKI